MTTEQIIQIIQFIASLIFGGLAVQVFNVYIKKQELKAQEKMEGDKQKIIDNATLRAELWAKVEALEKSLERAIKELNDYREKYNVLFTEYNVLKVKHEMLSLDHQELRESYNRLTQNLDKKLDVKNEQSTVI